MENNNAELLEAANPKMHRAYIPEFELRVDSRGGFLRLQINAGLVVDGKGELKNIDTKYLKDALAQAAERAVTFCDAKCAAKK